MNRLPAVAIVCALLLGCAGTSAKRNELNARRAFADELVKRGEWRGAFDFVDRLHRDDPSDAYTLMLRGIIYTELGMFAEAEADLRDATRLDPDLAPAHAALGVLHDLQHRPADAVVCHRRAVELQPRDPKYLNNLGFSLFASGRPREAIPVFQEALRSAPTDARVRNNLGFAYAAAGDFSSAAMHFDRGGDAAQAKNNLGWWYERHGSLAQAFEQYVQALRVNPDAAAARVNLSRVAAALGRTVPADVAAPPPRS